MGADLKKRQLPNTIPWPANQMRAAIIHFPDSNFHIFQGVRSENQNSPQIQTALLVYTTS